MKRPGRPYTSVDDLWMGRGLCSFGQDYGRSLGGVPSSERAYSSDFLFF